MGTARPSCCSTAAEVRSREKWIPFFSSHFRVIAPEQMGHGRTADLVDRPFRYHDMAEDTVELMRQLEIESAAVVGYSDGGIIALDMAAHHPERVTRLAVTGANARFDGYTAENQELVRSFDSDEEPVSDTYARLSPDERAIASSRRDGLKKWVRRRKTTMSRAGAFRRSHPSDALKMRAGAIWARSFSALSRA